VQGLSSNHVLVTDLDSTKAANAPKTVCQSVLHECLTSKMKKCSKTSILTVDLQLKLKLSGYNMCHMQMLTIS